MFIKISIIRIILDLKFEFSKYNIGGLITAIEAKA